MKYKVGMVVEFKADGKHGIGEIVKAGEKCLLKLLGKDAGTGHGGNGYHKGDDDVKDYWWVEEKEVLSVVRPEEIHITRKDNEVHAVLKNGGKVIARSKAVCSPEDEFDFWKGSSLAYSRLIAHTCENTKADPEPEYVEIVREDGVSNAYNFGEVCKILENGADYYKLSRVSDELIQIVSKTDTKPLKAVKRAAKPGEYIVLVKNGSFSFDDIGNVMKVYKTVGEVTVCLSSEFVVFQEKPDKGLWSYFQDEYVVLEGYEPPKKFVQHLEHKDGENYGTIGEKTPMKDAFGKELFVGDLVKFILPGDPASTFYEFVVKTERYEKKPFVMGIEMLCKVSGEIKDAIVIKVQPYEQINNGDMYGRIKAVLKE